VVVAFRDWTFREKDFTGDLGSEYGKVIKILFLPYGQKYLHKDFHPINPSLPPHKSGKYLL